MRQLHVDALVGRLLDRLVSEELDENTIIVLWGDHGFHLGEQGLWTKANNYELSTRVPLIISSPHKVASGTTSDALVELVDVYPTLADLCGLPAPDDVEGISLKPLLTDPDQPWKQAVFSQYPREITGSRHRGHGAIMGYAIRTHRYRYVEWRKWDSQQVIATELYDHNSDPAESRNVANHSAQAGRVRQLSGILSRGWRAALPHDRRTDQ